MLIVVILGVIVAAYASDARDGLDTRAALLGAGVLALLAWCARIALGVWRARRFDLVAALVTFAGMAVGGAWAAVDVIRRIQVDRVPFGTPRFHLMAPAVITVAAAAAVVLAGGALRADDQA